MQDLYDIRMTQRQQRRSLQLSHETTKAFLYNVKNLRCLIDEIVLAHKLYFVANCERESTRF